MVKQKFLPIKNTNNPGSFNYANYCHLRNIYESAYLREHEFQFTNKNTTTSTTLFNRWNFNTRKILNQYITDSSAKGIAEALLIGYRKNVDDETWQTYSNTGIVHVIAISGMHMAMIYGSMIWLMFRIPFLNEKNWSLCNCHFNDVVLCLFNRFATLRYSFSNHVYLYWGGRNYRQKNVDL